MQPPRAARPDLTGLSCRWKPIDSRRGCILSMIVSPSDNTEESAHDDVIGDLFNVFEAADRGGQTVPEDGPDFGCRPKASTSSRTLPPKKSSRAKEKRTHFLPFGC